MMNQICKVCGEPAAGFHFGAFTCEGCKSFFGRSYNNLSSISECKNNGKCIIDKKNRTTCKACRLRKCYTVGMSKGGSRYGRRSNWFKIHCLLQEQQQQAVDAAGKSGGALPPSNGFGDMATAAAVAAQQHLQQQRSSHMAQHMGGLLGYPGYLPEMSPFLSAAAAAATRHPGDSSAAAAALPFFNMMNGLPAPQSAYQLPPHLLFSGYHPGAAAAAAADAAYRSEMFQHRQSIDSLTESQRYSPAARSTHSSVPSEERLPSARQSPVLCVSGDEAQHSALSSQHSSAAASPISAATASTHHIHSPIAIRATPQASPLQQQQQHEAALSAPLVNVTPPKSQPSSPVQHAADQHSEVHASFAAKMQSLSPVSVCSISAESLPTATSSCNSNNATAAVADDQDCPMDLSMKTSRSSVHSFDTSAGESDASEEELRQAAAAATRRKFYQLSEQESDASSDASAELVKRQKLVAESQNYNGFSSNPTSLRGIFVCV